MNKKYSQGGFSLIELSIVLVISSLVLVGAIQIYEIYNEKQKVERSNSLMSDVDQAFNDFPDRYIPSTIVADGQGRLTGTYYARLPRPAPLNSATAGNDFNQEVAETDVAAAIASGNLIRVPGTGGSNVLIGKLPAGTLDIRNEYMRDIHGNYVLYAVTESATVDLNFSGAIRVIEEGIDYRETSPTRGEIIPYGLPHENVQYVVVSMGENGDGAYAFDGSRVGVCPSDSVREGENCNLNDATFRVSLLNERDDNTRNDDYYDDTVIFKNSVTSGGDSLPVDVLVPAKDGETFRVTRNDINFKNYEILSDGYLNWAWTHQEANFGRYSSGTEFIKIEAGDTVTNAVYNRSDGMTLRDKDGNVVDRSTRKTDDEFIFATNPSVSNDNGYNFSRALGGGSEGDPGSFSKTFRLYADKK